MEKVIITPGGILRAHEVPMIPATIRMLAGRIVEQMGDSKPDWEWVIANLKEAHDLALVGCEHAGQAICPDCGCHSCACDTAADEG